jgi:hypothetical protein
MTTDQAIAAIRNSAEAQSYNQSATVQAAQNAAVAPVASNIAAAYQQYLGRSPEPGAAEAWANAVASGQMTAEQALSAIASSPEAQAYQTYSSAGYGFNSGGAVKGYADGGAASYEDLVNSAYQDFLHRAPDEAGFKSWLNALTSGAISPADFENRFKGAGYEDDIVNAYQTSLNRDPTPSEIANWNTALTNKSMTLNDVMGRIQKSPEATSQQYYANVPSPDKFSQRQGGRMYDIDIGRVERIPELGRMAAPVNVQQQFQNNEIARLQNELEAAKSEKSAAPTSGQGGPDGGAGGNANGGRINAVDSALRMIKADRR